MIVVDCAHVAALVTHAIANRAVIRAELMNKRSVVGIFVIRDASVSKKFSRVRRRDHQKVSPHEANPWLGSQTFQPQFAPELRPTTGNAESIALRC